jgi:hypothetical protein
LRPSRCGRTLRSNLEIRRRRFFAQKYVGTFHIPDGDITVVHYSPASLDFGPPGRTVYEPYVTAN